MVAQGRVLWGQPLDTGRARVTTVEGGAAAGVTDLGRGQARLGPGFSLLRPQG